MNGARQKLHEEFTRALANPTNTALSFPIDLLA